MLWIHGEVEVQLHAVLTATLDGGASADLSLGKESAVSIV
jgi:hypothetical protein